MESTPNTSAKLHFIVPCKGRLDMVKQTIDAAISQSDTTYTLVDFSCPQGTGNWVRENYPDARVYLVEDRPYFHLGEARNIGANLIEDGYLCFLDTDVKLHPDFSKTILAMITPGVYLTGPRCDPRLWGMLICSKADFDTAGGYDEIIRGWGMEDTEMRKALGQIGLQPLDAPDWSAVHVDHEDELRTAFYEVKNKYDSVMINKFYCAFKDVPTLGGNKPDREALRRVYNYTTQRYIAGFPRLSWPEAANAGEVMPRVFRTLAQIGHDALGVTASNWGSVRIFRIERAEQPAIVELLTTYNRETVAVCAPGLAEISGMTLLGDVFFLPVENGLAYLTLTSEPIFLFGDVEFVEHPHVSIAPAPGPSLSVWLTPSEGFAGIVELAVTIGEREPSSYTIAMEDAAPAFISIPVTTLTALEQPREVTVSVTGNGVTREIMRRTTFLTALKVTEEQAAELAPPEHLVSFQVGGHSAWVDAIPESYQGLDDLSANVAWGWTDTALVCWITRHDDVWTDGAWNGDGVQIAVQPENVSANFAPSLQFTVCWKDEKSWVELVRTFVDPPEILNDAVLMEHDGNPRRMLVRLPFATLGITPGAGHALGLSMLFSDSDGDGRKGWLEWGGGIGHGRNPGQYNEITLR